MFSATATKSTSCAHSLCFLFRGGSCPLLISFSFPNPSFSPPLLLFPGTSLCSPFCPPLCSLFVPFSAPSLSSKKKKQTHVNPLGGVTPSHHFLNFTTLLCYPECLLFYEESISTGRYRQKATSLSEEAHLGVCEN